jgi:hypothetical protein
MRVLLSTYRSRGGVEPMVGLAVRSRALGAEVRVCTPPHEEFVALLARAGVPQVPLVPQAGGDQFLWPDRVAGTIRTDGPAVAATLLLDAVSIQRRPVPA